jgi:hypothetical protein
MTRRADRPSIVALQLFGLGGFAVAQPLFDILGQHAEFFVAHDARPSDLVLLVLLLSVGVPVLSIGFSWLGGSLSGGLTPGSATPAVGLLTTLVALPILNRLGSAPAVLMIVAAATLGVAAGWAYWRRAGVRLFLTALSPAAAIFPIWFLFATPVATLVRPPSPVSTSTVPIIDATTPIVMVVFDELPIASLLDGGDRIRRERYPNFAALADTSHWFRNGTTVAINTTDSVPSLLSGRRPRDKRLPTAADHPDNLFRLLSGGGYGLRVFEWHTSLCDDPICAEGKPARSWRARMHSMVPDIAVIYGHLVLPKRIAEILPSVDATWNRFGQTAEASAGASGSDRSESRAPDSVFASFLDAIGTGERSTFYFAHLGLPHVPWKYFPSGREYGPMNMPVVPHGKEGLSWVGDEWQVTQAYQRHLLQVGLADNLVGRLIDRLEEAGLFEESMIVLVADHGISFEPGGLRRMLSDSNRGDIANVPLFVKLPGQSRGTVSDRNVETVDLVPSIAQVLGVEVPWDVDGASVFDPTPERQTKAVTTVRKRAPGDSVEYSTQSLGPARRRSVARKLSLFGESPEWDALFDIGPRSAELRGMERERLVGEPRVAEVSDMEVELDQPEQWDEVDPGGSYVPAHITGRLVGPGAEGKLALAVAVNGVVRATTWSFRAKTGDVRFTALLPEDSFGRGGNQVEVLHLDLAGARARAAPIRQPSRSSFRLVAEGQGMALETADGRRLVVEGRGRAKAKISASQMGATLRGYLRPVDGDPLPDTLVVTLDGQPLFSAPFDQVLTPASKDDSGDLVRFQVRLPQYVIGDSVDLRIFVILGERAEPVMLR